MARSVGRRLAAGGWWVTEQGLLLAVLAYGKLFVNRPVHAPEPESNIAFVLRAPEAAHA